MSEVEEKIKDWFSLEFFDEISIKTKFKIDTLYVTRIPGGFIVRYKDEESKVFIPMKALFDDPDTKNMLKKIYFGDEK